MAASALGSFASFVCVMRSLVLLSFGADVDLPGPCTDMVTTSAVVKTWTLLFARRL